jgi:hypothetical protein
MAATAKHGKTFMSRSSWHRAGSVESVPAIFKDFAGVDHGRCSTDAADGCGLLDAIRQMGQGRLRRMTEDQLRQIRRGATNVSFEGTGDQRADR